MSCPFELRPIFWSLMAQIEVSGNGIISTPKIFLRALLHPKSAGKSLTKHLLKFYRPLRHPTKMAQKKGLGPPTFCCGLERSSTGAKSLRNTRPQGGCKNPRFLLPHYAKFFQKKFFFFNYAEIFARSARLKGSHPVKSCLRPIEKIFFF